MSIRRTKMPYQLSGKSYFLSDISRSNCPLPLPCLIEDGYHGASAWDTVSAGELIFVNTLEKRPRALAFDGRIHYSIPLDYPLKFTVISKDNEYRATKTIEEIVNHYKLPVTLKVDQKNTTLHLASNLRTVLHLGNVDVTRTYDEKYFTGHSVIDNELQNETFMLPTFLKVKVRIVEGIAGYSTAQWVDVLEAWKTKVKKNSSNTIKPPIDIVMFSSIPQEAQTKATSTTIQKASEDIYETLEPTTYVKLNFNLAQRKSNVYTTLSVSEPAKTSARTEETRNQSTKTRAEQADARKSYQFVQTELQQTLPHRHPSESNRPVPPPKLYKTLSVDQSKRRIPAPPSEAPGTNPLTPHEAPGTNPLTPHEAPGTSPQTPHEPSSSGQLSSSIHLHPSTSDPPSNKQDPADAYDVEIDPDYVISPRGGSNIHSLKDVPASLEKLTTEEVADCLRLLKMSKYVDSFLANQVDGALLSEFNDEILTGDLQMSPLHAKKLLMFAQKGWRPTQGLSEVYL